ncbi:hypothetical protein AB0333_16215 [Citricoccus sp. NPDC079358]|uniref:hypothetical protein n=1 Tax=Citricoccus sp. NPDC079358 TaxID=3154653 RepID=UPI00344D138C
MTSSDRYGLFYTAARVCEVLGGKSEHALDELVASHQLLRVTTSGGLNLYPAFQFVDASVMVGLPPLLEILLGSGADPWAAAHWLTARTDHNEGQAAVEVLASGRDDLKADPIKLAHHDAAGWADSS